MKKTLLLTLIVLVTTAQADTFIFDPEHTVFDQIQKKCSTSDWDKSFKSVAAGYVANGIVSLYTAGIASFTYETCTKPKFHSYEQEINYAQKPFLKNTSLYVGLITGAATAYLMQRYIFKPSPEQFATLSKHQRNFLNTIFITKDSTNRASHLIEWYAMSGHSAASIGHEINALISKIECILYQFTIIEKYQTAEFYVIKQELLFIKNELHTTYTELIQTTEWTRSNALESTEQKRKLEREIKFNTLANLLGALNRR